MTARMGDDPEALLRAAVEHHQAGRLPEAEALYRRLLETHPGNGQVLNLMGLVAHQPGRHEQAVELITEAIAKAPPNAHFLLNLGVAQKAMGARQRGHGVVPPRPGDRSRLRHGPPQPR